MSAAVALLDSLICNGGFSPLSPRSCLTGHVNLAAIRPSATQWAMAEMGPFKRKHRIIAALLGAVFMFAYAFVGRPMLRTMGATTYGPLSSHHRDILVDDAQSLLAKLRPINELSGNSLRFVAMPSFGWRWMAVSVSEINRRVAGQLIVLDRKTDLLADREFSMDQSAFEKLLKRWDDRTENYWGDFRMFTDGTPLAFERQRGRIITAGIGNSPCHFDVLGDLAAVYIGPNAKELMDLRAPYIDRLLRSGNC